MGSGAQLDLAKFQLSQLKCIECHQLAEVKAWGVVNGRRLVRRILRGKSQDVSCEVGHCIWEDR